MTDRLKAALKQLDEAELEEVTQLAESLASTRQAQPTARRATWKLDWVGALRDRPEQSGLEAQQAAIREWINLVRGKESA